METDADLPTLIQRKEHLNVLRYVRVHQLRESALVVKHGKALLGDKLQGKLSDDLTYLTVLEQICLAAADEQNHTIVQLCLAKLRLSIPDDSARFKLLLARCLDAAGDVVGAERVYDDLLQKNPSSLLAAKRKYCLLKSQVGQESASAAQLNNYLQQNYSDTAGWYELAHLRMELGDFKGAAYALEEVLMSAPADAALHTELAECYATIGDLDHLLLARKHMAQALELDPAHRRAQFGLVTVANAYLETADESGKKHTDSFEVEVAKELIKFGAEQVLKSYKGTSIFDTVQKLMAEYTETL